MASLSNYMTSSKSLSPNHYPFHRPLRTSPTSLQFPSSLPHSSSLHISSSFHFNRQRGMSSVVPRAGPTSSQLIFAFVFPISLLAITAFTAFRIGDRLDQKFLEELALNEAIREAEEEEEDNDVAEVVTPRKEEPALSRTRNRPKREV